MGFSTLIDILGSTLVGGMLLLILLRLNDSGVQNTYMYGGELIVQQNLVDAVQVLEHDFRKIGFCADWEKLPDPLLYIIEADSHKISFQTDVDSDGNVDTLTYYTGPTSELTETPNPRDMMLYRVVNNASPKGSNLGITQFDLVYFDALGNKLSCPVASPSLIITMQINIRIEDVYGYDTANADKSDNEMYATAFWRQIRLAARNIKNR